MSYSVQIIARGVQREALASLLSDRPEIELVDENAHVLLVDTSAGWREELVDTVRIHSEQSLLRAVLLTRGEPQELAEAARLGIHCFVSPEDPLSELVDALERAARGQAYWSSSVQVALFGVLEAAGTTRGAPAASRALSRLSARELEVLRLAAAMLSNEEIATSLCVSTTTVKTHLSRAYQKLGIHRRGELYRMTRLNGAS
jgi:DNA-binding NarL/FixJ family response regulator